MTQSEIEKIEIEKKMEEQMVKNLKAKLKKKKDALIWGEKQGSSEIEENEKSLSMEDKQLESLTAGLSKLKNKMKKKENFSEQSSEEKIMVRVGSSKRESQHQKGKESYRNKNLNLLNCLSYKIIFFFKFLYLICSKNH